jgi:hypothetical protein
MLASGVADHALHLDNHFARLERLAKKAAVGGNIDVCQFLIGGQRSCTACASARHLDIGEKQRPRSVVKEAAS